jgi:hypothetical protein
MNKMIGYFLVCIGLALIFFSMVSMFKVFADAQAPVHLITMSKMSVSTQYGPMDIDMSLLSNVLNLVLHGFFMFFIVGAGARIMGGGINLIKVDTFADALKTATIKDIKQL